MISSTEIVRHEAVTEFWSSEIQDPDQSLDHLGHFLSLYSLCKQHIGHARGQRNHRIIIVIRPKKSIFSPFEVFLFDFGSSNIVEKKFKITQLLFEPFFVKNLSHLAPPPINECEGWDLKPPTSRETDPIRPPEVDEVLPQIRPVWRCQTPI